MVWFSDISKDFIINKSDRPDGMRTSIDDFENDELAPPPGFGKGYEPRDLSKNPVGSLEGSMTTEEFNKNIPLIPFENWPELIQEQERNKSRLSDIRMTGNKGQPIPAYDQNGQGFCWTYSTLSGVTLTRAKMGLPYVRLSGHSLACKLTNFQDRGGWCGWSASAATKHGFVPESLWAEKSMSRRHDTAENWEVAENFTITEGFMDLQQSVYDMSLTFQQLGSCILGGIYCPVDFNWWAHSILGMDLVYVSNQYPVNDPRCYGLRILNSWRDSWGFLGTGIILGRKAVPNGAVAIRNVAYYEGHAA